MGNHRDPGTLPWDVGWKWATRPWTQPKPASSNTSQGQGAPSLPRGNHPLQGALSGAPSPSSRPG